MFAPTISAVSSSVVINSASFNALGARASARVALSVSPLVVNSCASCWLAEARFINISSTSSFASSLRAGLASSMLCPFDRNNLLALLNCLMDIFVLRSPPCL